ncbi:hypothetical protein HYH03_007465 [Edaphochlamys debaryana]|uniref:Uncharacterized protein n=1 Tax=Edaphochlamys debaryana TaxID=47281 RepID=A0A836C0E7_9CHLO|nr:hypothetical protein HYH03_007465 [Edaphochlamys debaryana]|eukprot:KAG2494413.1 hypothetical protein HYH03_007465 [Edaphochlamys debaryana]
MALIEEEPPRPAGSMSTAASGDATGATSPDPSEGNPPPKPRTVPKMFASPRKGGPAKGVRVVERKESMRSRLRKALAPYLTTTYLQGEMHKRFTLEYMDSHPPPPDEADMPAYIQQHLRELNRVTERWSGCVVRSLDPLAHQMAVDDRLQRQRNRMEGLPVEEPFDQIMYGPAAPGQSLFGGNGVPVPPKTAEELEEEAELEEAEEAGRLTTQQIVSAVDLVSDIKVWEQILAAKKAEERRQHAIAELHLHHAARIIQRSWRGYISRKQEEKARLDALVSPDVQIMLSAAAYKAMRDARNKIQLQKLRKSLSRKARVGGFGSTAPRELDPKHYPTAGGEGVHPDPEARPGARSAHPPGRPPLPGKGRTRTMLLAGEGPRSRASPAPASQHAEAAGEGTAGAHEGGAGHASGPGTGAPGSRARSTRGSASGADGSGAEGEGEAAAGSGADDEAGEELFGSRRARFGGHTVVKAKSIVARSAQILRRLVSARGGSGLDSASSAIFDDVDSGAESGTGAGAGAGAAGAEGRSRSRAQSRAEGAADELSENPEAAVKALTVQWQGEAEQAARELARVLGVAAGEAGGTEGAEGEGQHREAGEGTLGETLGAAAQGDEEPGEDGGEPESPPTASDDEDEDEDGDGEGEGGEGGDGEGGEGAAASRARAMFGAESPEAALLEAEEVVQVAAALAAALMESDEEESGEGEEGSASQAGGEAGEAGEAAAAAAAAARAVLAPPPLKAAAEAAAAGGGIQARPPPGAAAGGPSRRARGGLAMGDGEAAALRQVIAGAFAAAAAPVIGRSGALAVARLGLGEPLPEPRSARPAAGTGPSPRVAAARLRPAAAAGVAAAAAPPAAASAGVHASQDDVGAAGPSRPLEIRAAAAAVVGLLTEASGAAKSRDVSDSGGVMPVRVSQAGDGARPPSAAQSPRPFASPGAGPGGDRPWSRGGPAGPGPNGPSQAQGQGPAQARTSMAGGPEGSCAGEGTGTRYRRRSVDAPPAPPQQLSSPGGAGNSGGGGSHFLPSLAGVHMEVGEGAMEVGAEGTAAPRRGRVSIGGGGAPPPRQYSGEEGPAAEPELEGGASVSPQLGSPGSLTFQQQWQMQQAAAHAASLTAQGSSATAVSTSGGSAAPAAAAAGGPQWAVPRYRAAVPGAIVHSVPPPPGAATLSGALPNPRGLEAAGGGVASSSSPGPAAAATVGGGAPAAHLARDPAWLMFPPIMGSPNRSQTGPPGLGGPASGAAAAAGGGGGPAAKAGGGGFGPLGITRTASDPTLQRPIGLAATLAGGKGSNLAGSGGSGGGRGSGGGMAAQVVVGRARRASMFGPGGVSSSLDGQMTAFAVAVAQQQVGGGSGSPMRSRNAAGRLSVGHSGLQPLHGAPQQYGAFMVNGVAGGGGAALVRQSVQGAPAPAEVASPPLVSSTLAGGGGGAGGSNMARFTQAAHPPHHGHGQGGGTGFHSPQLRAGGGRGYQPTSLMGVGQGVVSGRS